MEHFGSWGDCELQSELARLLASGSHTEARIIAHLAAVEDRRLHLDAGSSSLFDYCCKRLGLSENEAFHRIAAARLARRFPIVFDLVERRALHLTAVCLLRDYLTPENHRELLADASGRTKLQVQELLARRFPRPDVASTIRKLPARREAAAPQLSAVPQNRTIVEPLSAARYRIQLNASPRLKEKLERARDLLSHSNPTGDLATVIERALDLLLEHSLKKRFAETKRPRVGKAPDPERSGKRREYGEIKAARRTSARATLLRCRTRRGHIANAVKREIAARDGHVVRS